MKIGIGITTYNRYPVFKKSYERVVKLAPEGAKIFVVDDCSEKSVPEANVRFDKNKGIAAAKNACIAALDDCDYIFLFDDDTYPLIKNWYQPYINSGLNHAMMIFPRLANGTSTNNRLIKAKNGLVWYQNPCGNMLFFTKKAIEVVGGMDTGYGQWGGEHQDISQRIFNNGLTPHPFIDVEHSTALFYSHDYHLTAERSVPKEVRKKCIKHIMPKLNAAVKSKEFIPYKDMKGRLITTYFTHMVDPQRDVKWGHNEDNFNGLSRLTLSIAKINNLEHINTPFCVIKDSAYKKPYHPNPYLERWIQILNYLESVQEDYIFCVDATDVIMLNSPFKENLGNYLWVGDEPGTINNAWLLKHHRQKLFEGFFKTHKNKPLLNAGVIGGRTSVVRTFLTRLVWYIQNHDIVFSDMALFNFVLYTEFPEQIRHGRKVTTVF